MKFPRVNFRVESIFTRMMVLVVCVAAAAVSISAQKSGWSFAPEAIGIDIEQCANGPLSAPIHCNVNTGNDGYTRGNVNESKSHYFEGQFVPIRFIATDLVVGQTYTVTLGYDYTKSGKYATDYLGNYNATESVQNDPCVGVTGCTLAGVNPYTIPVDPEVTAGYDQIAMTADDIVQTPGSFSCFGCTITAFSGYTRTGATTGDSTKNFTLTFTADKTNIVIAYGSHISSRRDWGVLNSAINISGSPYHNYVVNFPGANGGSRDLQLSATAVIFPAIVTIEKTVVNFFLETSGGQSFSFQSSQPIFPNTTNFSLFDNQAETYTPVLADRVGGTIASSDVLLFGAGNTITVSEVNIPATWSLAGITCTSVNGTNNNTFGATSVTINLEEGEFVNCKFHNTQLQPSAAPATISGRATDSFGTGISGARVTVMNAQTGETFVATTNSFGYYTVTGTEVGNFYTMTISHRRYTFADDTRTFSLHDNLSGVDFIANP